MAGPTVNVHVGIPWRAGDPWREQAFAYVQIHLRGAGFDPVPYDDGADVFSRAGSRNLAVRCADADVVILHDADMILPATAYIEAAEIARSSGRLVIGFSRYRPLSKARTVEAFGGADPFTLDPVDELVDFSVGGVVAITPYAWWKAGGMDERYVDWGCEDFAFANAAAGALGPLIRLDGPGVHLWHPHAADPDNHDQQRNSALLAGGDV